MTHLRVPRTRGTHFGGRHKKDCSILGSILGFPTLGNCHFILGAYSGVPIILWFPM